MNRKGLRFLAAFATLLYILVLAGCGHDQQLTSITVQPNTEDFGFPDPSLHVQLRALGHYIHPPVTKDITDQVTWATNTPDVATVSATGLLAPGGFACGDAQITATVRTNHSTADRPSSGAIITGSMTATVECP
jgi:hypothetical protein